MSTDVTPPDDEGGRHDPTSRRAMYERLVNVDRLVKRMAVLINELHPDVHALKQENEHLRARVTQQDQAIAELRATIGQMRAAMFSGATTTSGR